MRRNVFYIAWSLSVALSILFHVSSPFAQQNYSNTTVKNDSGKPLSLIAITDSDGNKIADLFMSGKEMSFGNGQRSFKGEGYVQALPDKFVNLSIIATCKDKSGKERRKQLLIGVNRLQWDEKGTTVAIRGINPVISATGGEQLGITSDLENPQVKDGALLLSIEGKGKFYFVIKYANDHNWAEGYCNLF